MVDRLLPYYNRELSFLRREGAAFADIHPGIAGRLRLTGDTVQDPHVGRLIESFAFLTARLRHKIEDDFPELTDALLGVLYPHYLRPIPSMSIVRFSPVADLDGAHVIPAGAEMESEPVGGETCQFRTCYPTTLWPVTLNAVALTGRPLVAPNNPRAPGAVASLRITVRCLDDGKTLTDLGVDRLRFFLRGQPQEVFPLYELIHNNCVSVALAENAVDPDPVILGADAIKPVGFAEDEGMFPYPARSFPGYRLLTEYFAFPEKFLFFDLTGLQAKTLVGAGNKMDIFLYFNKASGDLERSISADSLALGCTPIANLFQLRAEPIQMTQTVSEYRLVPDARRPQSTEVYSIEKVISTDKDGDQKEFLPFYSLKHSGEESTSSTFYYATRAPGGPRDPGTDIQLSLVDLDFNPSSRNEETLSVETWCLNRDLPGKLPFGGGHPNLKLSTGSTPVETIQCVTPPTPTLRPAIGRRGYWRLISHLSLNHLSLTDTGEGADALREILKLYDFRDSAETRAIIDSLLEVSVTPATARVSSGGQSGLCRGVDVSVLFDGQRFSGSGLFLLASVLERFLALYATINSFTRLTASIKGQSQKLRTWPARAGDRQLI